MKNIETIDDVIVNLDYILNDCIEKESRIGYFASLYMKMTQAVKHGIINNLFEDGSRMEQLDIVFAKRFIDAYASFQNNKTITKSWLFVFDQSANRLIILQHLLLGINTHINLDLGIAAAAISDKNKIHTLKADFDRINEIIGSLLSEVQTDLGEVCFPMRLLKKINMQSVDSIINFSISLARKSAWTHALALSNLNSTLQATYIQECDQLILNIAKNIVNPSFGQTLLLKSIQWFESNNIRSNIHFLKD